MNKQKEKGPGEGTRNKDPLMRTLRDPMNTGLETMMYTQSTGADEQAGVADSGSVHSCQL